MLICYGSSRKLIQHTFLLLLTKLKKTLYIMLFNNNFEGFKISVEEGTADVKIARELELQVNLKMRLNCFNLMIKF